jgi:class 3 adenylate cyclase
VVGETPNLAARLQAMAPAKGVMIAEATRRLLGDLFEYRDLGSTEAPTAVRCNGLTERGEGAVEETRRSDPKPRISGWT